MMFVPLRPAPVARRLLLLGTLAALCGCQKEEDVRHYTVPKEKAPPLMADAADRPLQRILGAIVPWGGDGELWVFKVMGPDAAVKEYEAEFTAFIDSVTFKQGQKEPNYKTPENWRPSKGTRFSVAAFRLGANEQAPELTITPTRGTVIDNLNRWRSQQLGLKPVDDTEFKQTTKEIKLGDATGVLVNLSGTGSGGMGGPPFAGKAPPFANQHAGMSSQLKYTLPAGWEKSDELTKGIIRREAVFNIKDGSRTAEASVTVAGGAVIDNVNRWRHEVGLGELTEEQLSKEVTAMLVAGNPAVYVDESGGGDSPDRKRILGVMVPRGGRTWFFALRGPADLVGREKPAFEAFVKSVRFEGSNNE
jgi:hypothetical protein